MRKAKIIIFCTGLSVTEESARLIIKRRKKAVFGDFINKGKPFSSNATLYF